MGDSAPTALTLAQAIEEYLDWQALDRGRSPNTVRAYGIDLAGFRAFAGAAGIEQLADLDRDLLREFQVAMARAAAAPSRSRPRPGTAGSSHSGRFYGSVRGRNGSSSVSTPMARPASTISRWPTNRFWSSSDRRAAACPGSSARRATSP